MSTAARRPEATGLAKLALTAASLALFAALAPMGGVRAQQAGPAAAPCSGTLCDAYYGMFGNKAASPETAAPATAQATPVTVPTLGRLFSSGSSDTTAPASSPATAARPSSSLVQVDGGGLLGPGGLLTGGSASNQRCTGTLCDAYYGVVGGPPEPAPPVATPVETAAAAPDEARGARKRRAVETAERQEKPRCAATGRDLWQCYR